MNAVALKAALESGRRRSLESLQRGERIPGSAYVRDFCLGCRDAIRVLPGEADGKHFCSGCAPSLRGVEGTHEHKLTDGNWSGGLDNGVRAIEETRE